MTNDEYLALVAREMGRSEESLKDDTRALLLLLLWRLRQSLIASLPDAGVSRPLVLNALLTTFTSELRDYNNQFLRILLAELERIDADHPARAASFSGANNTQWTYRPRRGLTLLSSTRSTGTTLSRLFGITEDNLLTSLGTDAVTPFMQAHLRAIKAKIMAGIMRGDPTREIARGIVAEQTRKGYIQPAMRRGTIYSQLRNRDTALIANAVWDVATTVEQSIFTRQQRITRKTDTPFAPNGWIWNAVLDPKTCPVCRPLHNTRRATYTDFPYIPPVHPRCVLGDTEVTPGSVMAATRAIYSGDIVTVRTKSGRQFSVTAQHPVLTMRGWLPANQLRNSDHLISHSEWIPTTFNHPHLHDRPTPAADVFQALASSGCVSSDRVPAAPMHFHGDGVSIKGEIDVVWTDRLLQHNTNPSLQASLTQLLCVHRNSELLDEPRFSPLDLLFLSVNAASCDLVGLVQELEPLLSAQPTLTQQHGLTRVASNYPSLFEPVYDHLPGATQLLRQLLDAHPSLVTLDDVVNVDVQPAHDVPVYDFTTVTGIYSVSTLVSHNCRCKILPAP